MKRILFSETNEAKMKQSEQKGNTSCDSLDSTMSKGVRYHFMKWECGFFDKVKMKSLSTERQELKVTLGVFAQYLYILLLNESITHEGVLRYDEEESYSSSRIAKVFGLDERNVEMAMDLLESERLIRWDDNRNLILPYAVEHIGKKGEKSSTERVRKCRALKKEREKSKTGNADETLCNVSRNGSNSGNALDIDIEKEKEEEIDKEKESTPHNPPQGGEVVDLFSGLNDSSGDAEHWESVNPNKNGSSCFAQSNSDAPPITREELSDYVAGINAALKATDRITQETEEEFWKWLASHMFKNSRNHVVTKWNVKHTFSYWWKRFREEGGGGSGGKTLASQKDIAVSMSHSTEIGSYKPMQEWTPETN